jgi:hypothetical protein
MHPLFCFYLKYLLHIDRPQIAKSLFRNGNRLATHLPADCQPLNRLYAHLAAYITDHHTYFTGCETKNTAHAGCCKGNVNTSLSLIYQTKGRYFSTDHESLLRVSLRPLPPKSKATSNYQIVIFHNG